MATDYQARLTLVQAAIDAILTGQAASYSLDGQTVTKLDLPMLMAQEERLQARIDRAAGTRRAFRQAVPK